MGYSDSDDDSDNGHHIDDWLESIQERSNTRDGGQWTYLARSERGSSVYGRNRTRIRPPNNGFKLQFNVADQINLEKARNELRHSYSASKRKLNITQDRPF